MILEFSTCRDSEGYKSLARRCGALNFAPQNPASTLPQGVSQQLEPMDDPMYSNLACHYPETARAAG